MCQNIITVLWQLLKDIHPAMLQSTMPEKETVASRQFIQLWSSNSGSSDDSATATSSLGLNRLFSPGQTLCLFSRVFLEEFLQICIYFFKYGKPLKHLDYLLINLRWLHVWKRHFYRPIYIYIYLYCIYNTSLNPLHTAHTLCYKKRRQIIQSSLELLICITLIFILQSNPFWLDSKCIGLFRFCSASGAYNQGADTRTLFPFPRSSADFTTRDHWSVPGVDSCWSVLHCSSRFPSWSRTAPATPSPLAAPASVKCPTHFRRVLIRNSCLHKPPAKPLHASERTDQG